MFCLLGVAPHGTPAACGRAQIGPVRLRRARSHLARGRGRAYGGSRGCGRYGMRAKQRGCVGGEEAVGSCRRRACSMEDADEMRIERREDWESKPANSTHYGPKQLCSDVK